MDVLILCTVWPLLIVCYVNCSHVLITSTLNMELECSSEMSKTFSTTARNQNIMRNSENCVIICVENKSFSAL
jgi:hypothetical protein